MPEGDTVHRHALQLTPRLVGQKVVAIYARGVRYAALEGETITNVQAQGKHLLIDVGPRARLHVHLGMNGRLSVVPRSELTVVRAARATLAVATAQVAALWSMARTVEVLRTAFSHAHPALRALGPDLLAADFDVGQVVARARATATHVPLGELLLDQRVACGIGNVYKSEVLFLERLNPRTPTSQLDDARLTKLFLHARELMQANLGPWRRTTTANLARNEWIPRGQGRMHIYRRNGRPCVICGTAVSRLYQGDPPRSTYFCAHCQPAALPAPGA